MVEDEPPPYNVNEELAKMRISSHVPVSSTDGQQLASDQGGCPAVIQPSTSCTSVLEPPPPYLPPPYQPNYATPGTPYTNDRSWPPDYQTITDSVGYTSSTQQLYYPGHSPARTAMNSGAPVIVQPYHQKTYLGHIILACIVTWFCGCICGIVAFRLALRAQKCTDPADQETPRQLARASIGMSVAGIAIGAIIIVIVVSFVSISTRGYPPGPTQPCQSFNSGFPC